MADSPVLHFKSNVNPDILKAFDVDFEDIIRADVRTPGSPLRAVVVEHAIAAFQQRISARNSRKTVRIHAKLDIAHENFIENEYPEFDITFTRSTIVGHPVANALRVLEMQLLLELVYYDPSNVVLQPGYDVSVVDIGGNWKYHLDNKSVSVHCCSPLLDAKDYIRESVRACSVFIRPNKDKQVRDAFNLLSSDNSFRCSTRAQYCPVTAPVGIMLHSSYDMSLIDVADTMVLKNMFMIYGVFIFDMSILIKDSGVIPFSNAYYEINRKKRRISFTFRGDTSLAYEHDLDTYLSYVSRSIFTNSDSSRYFAIELLYNRLGAQYYRVVAIKTPGPLASLKLTHYIWDSGRVGKTLVRFYSATEQDIIAGREYLRARYILAPSDLVEKIKDYAYTIPDDNFLPKTVMTYARSVNTRVIVQGKDVTTPERIPVDDLILLANAIYVYVYIEKYKIGQVVKTLLDDEKYRRSLAGRNGFLNFLCAIFNPTSEYSHQVDLDLFDGNGKTPQEIMHYVVEGQRQNKWLPTYRRLFYNFVGFFSKWYAKRLLKTKTNIVEITDCVSFIRIDDVCKPSLLTMLKSCACAVVSDDDLRFDLKRMKFPICDECDEPILVSLNKTIDNAVDGVDSHIQLYNVVDKEVYDLLIEQDVDICQRKDILRTLTKWHHSAGHLPPSDYRVHILAVKDTLKPVIGGYNLTPTTDFTVIRVSQVESPSIITDICSISSKHSRSTHSSTSSSSSSQHLSLSKSSLPPGTTTSSTDIKSNVKLDECDPIEKFHIVKTRGDGNCLFYCLLELEGHEQHALAAVRELKDRLLNSDLISSYPQVRDIILNDAWGDTDVIDLFSQVYQVHVCLHVRETSNVEFFGVLVPSPKKTIHILHTFNHFDRLCRKDDVSISNKHICLPLTAFDFNAVPCGSDSIYYALLNTRSFSNVVSNTLADMKNKLGDDVRNFENIIINFSRLFSTSVCVHHRNVSHVTLYTPRISKHYIHIYREHTDFHYLTSKTNIPVSVVPSIPEEHPTVTVFTSDDRYLFSVALAHSYKYNQIRYVSNFKITTDELSENFSKDVTFLALDNFVIDNAFIIVNFIYGNSVEYEDAVCDYLTKFSLRNIHFLLFIPGHVDLVALEGLKNELTRFGDLKILRGLHKHALILNANTIGTIPAFNVSNIDSLVRVPYHFQSEYFTYSINTNFVRVYPQKEVTSSITLVNNHFRIVDFTSFKTVFVLSTSKIRIRHDSVIYHKSLLAPDDLDHDLTYAYVIDWLHLPRGFKIRALFQTLPPGVKFVVFSTRPYFKNEIKSIRRSRFSLDNLSVDSSASTVRSCPPISLRKLFFATINELPDITEVCTSIPSLLCRARVLCRKSNTPIIHEPVVKNDVETIRTPSLSPTVATALPPPDPLCKKSTRNPANLFDLQSSILNFAGKVDCQLQVVNRPVDPSRPLIHFIHNDDKGYAGFAAYIARDYGTSEYCKYVNTCKKDGKLIGDAVIPTVGKKCLLVLNAVSSKIGFFARLKTLFSFLSKSLNVPVVFDLPAIGCGLWDYSPHDVVELIHNLFKFYEPKFGFCFCVPDKSLYAEFLDALVSLTTPHNQTKLITASSLGIDHPYSEIGELEKRWLESRAYQKHYSPTAIKYEVGTSREIYLRNAMREQLYYWASFEHILVKNYSYIYLTYVRSVLNKIQYLPKHVVNLLRNDREHYSLYDLRNQNWVIRPRQRIVYTAAFDGSKLIPIQHTYSGTKTRIITNSPSAHVLLMGDSLVLMNDALLFDHTKFSATYDKAFDIPSFRLPRITLVQGVPGCGKTTYIIKNHDEDKDIVLTSTREAAADIRERIGTSDKKRYATTHSYLLNSRAHYDVVWVDEALMRHAGEILLIAYYTRCTELKLLGDINQIPFINRTSLVLRYTSLIDYVDHTEYLNITYRCPLDVAAHFYSLYKGGMRSVNSNKNTMQVARVGNVSQIPYTNNTQYLCFKQSEKLELARKFKNISTVHEYQGKQCDNVILIRLSRKMNEEIPYNSVNHVLVALTRHRKSFTYYLPIGITDLTTRYVVTTLSSQQLTRAHYVKGGYLPVFDLDTPEVVAERSALKYTTNKISTILAVNDYPDITNVDFTPTMVNYRHPRYPKTYCPQITPGTYETLQFWYDHLLPQNSVYDYSFDQILCENEDICLDLENVAFSTAAYHKKKYSEPAIRSHLRTSVPVKRTSTQLETLLALIKRNLNIPEIQGFVDELYIVDLMIEKFVESYVHPAMRDTFDSYSASRVRLNSKIISDWLRMQPTDVMDRITDPDIPIWERRLNFYTLMNKLNVKPGLDTATPFEYSALQTIAYHTKSINVVFCTLFRELRKRLINVLDPRFIMYCDMSPDEFADLLTDRFRDIDLLKYQKLEIDISKYDKSQGRIFLLFEIELYRLLGAPEELLHLWFVAHDTTVLHDYTEQVTAFILYQRKSGDASTFFGNTVCLMGVISVLFSMSQIILAYFGGDDSGMFAKSFNDMNTLCANLFNLESKFFRYTCPYFCSKFLIYVDNHWAFIPDPVKVLTKLGRSDFVDWEHVEEYRISCYDLFKPFSNAIYNDALSQALNERYPNDMSDHSTLFSTLWYIVSDKERFAAMFYKNVSIEFKKYTKRPNLDI